MTSRSGSDPARSPGGPARVVAVLEGDGIGPEVTRSAIRVLRKVAGDALAFVAAPVGGQAIRAHGSPLPPKTIDVCSTADAVLLGAVGDPAFSDPDVRARPEDGLLQLRSRFRLFANLRPVRSWTALAEQTPLRAEVAQGVDLLFVRELTGGIYFGERREQGAGRVASDTMSYTVAEVERVAHLAFLAARRRRSKVASIDKANVLASSRLWRRTVERVARRYPDVELEHILVDAAAMHLVTRPARFDVILAPNLFGDILSDEASVIAGSLGMLPSASVGKSSFGVYEPVHGSAPDLVGKGEANPCGAILSGALLLRLSLGMDREATRIEKAVERTLSRGARTADMLPGRPEPRAESDPVPLAGAEFTEKILLELD